MNNTKRIMLSNQPSNPESYEMNNALQEALTCATCTYTPPNLASLRSALSTGKYSFDRDPPFTISPFSHEDQSSRGDISPREKTEEREAGYGQLMNASQRARYRELVLGRISRLAHSFSSSSGSDPRSRARDRARLSPSTGYAPRDNPEHPDPEMTTMLGFYQVDYHIHLHYITGRGILSFCRDVTDVHALRKWRAEVTSPSGPGDEDDGPGGRTRQRRGLWSDGPEFMDQISLWRRRWRERRARVEDTRHRWAGITERRVQRLRVQNRVAEGID